MALNKKQEFSELQNQIATFAKALSHPARVAILEKLADCNKCICGDIVEVMPLSQSTVSQHLKELKNAGLIQGIIEGASSCYCINWENLEKELETLNNIFSQLKTKNDSVICCVVKEQ
ncbi:MAG: ArsR family transcriptional regulator [Ignavibacteriae bacterium]|nr:MAG: ArsR family transcriptional regulator [Ignavibacteriota bacterium]